VLFRSCADYYVYDADDDLPLDMRKAVEKNESWTEEQRDNYYNMIRSRIFNLASIHPKLVVTQATYRQVHREIICGAFSDISLLWVIADHDLNVQRIRERDNYVSVEFFERTKVFFETPSEEVKVIYNNDGDADIIRQLIALYG